MRSHRSYEFFYQVGLSEFGNFGTIQIPNGLDTRELLTISINTDGSSEPATQSQKDEIEAPLSAKSELIIVDDGHPNPTARNDRRILLSNYHTHRTFNQSPAPLEKLSPQPGQTPLLPPPSRPKRPSPSYPKLMTGGLVHRETVFRDLPPRIGAILRP